MTAVQTVWVPFPTSTNNLYAHGKVNGHVRRFPSKQYKAWRKEAVLRIRLARLPLITEPVAVRLSLTPPSAARRDVDNYSKAVLDALVEARVLADDSQVQKLLSSWDHESETPGAFIEIGPAKAERPALSPSERATLIKMRRDGYRLCGVAPPNEVIRGLISKGYIKEIPGLLDGAPQGFAPAE